MLKNKWQPLPDETEKERKKEKKKKERKKERKKEEEEEEEERAQSIFLDQNGVSQACLYSRDTPFWFGTLEFVSCLWYGATAPSRTVVSNHRSVVMGTTLYPVGVGSVKTFL